MNASVKAKVTLGDTLGSTPNAVVPTNPREAECSASSATGQPRATRSGPGNEGVVRAACQPRREVKRTFDQDAIRGGVDRPDVARPVGVIQAALEREEAGNNLTELGEPACDHKGSERDGADRDDDGAQLDDPVALQSCRAQDGQSAGCQRHSRM